jgi:hypothetical protein
MKKGFVEVANKRKYQQWIDAHVPERCERMCRQKSEEMANAFPELRVVGVFSTMGFGGHAWCVNKKGEVVDPTYHQFKSYNHTREPFEMKDFPIGKCLVCGELIIPDTQRNRNEFCGTELGEHTRCKSE